jgi:hypothetical protein
MLAHVGEELTPKESEVMSNLANLIRPYSPKRNRNGDLPNLHPLNLAPLLTLSNIILEATGYPQFRRHVWPTGPPGKPHPLHITSAGLFGINKSTFDIDGVTSMTRATSQKKQIFDSFFDDLSAISRRYGLRFEHR